MEDVAALFRAPESADPNDYEALDDTGAGSRKRRRVEAAPLPAESGRLRLRPKVPVIHKGKKVARSEVFGKEEEEASDDGGGGHWDDDDDDEIIGGGPAIDAGAGGGFAISADVEEEYEKVLRETRSDLQVIRAPSAEEAEGKDREAKELKRQLDSWSALVELRIHLEGALALGHRLPSAEPAAALHAAEPKLGEEAESFAQGAQRLLAQLLCLQDRLAQRRGAPLRPFVEAAPAPGGPEPELHKALDRRAESLLDWELRVADGFKERTRLDVRKTFKVLDQSLSAQMQAHSETDAAKLHRRCAPPPERFTVLGADLLQPETAAAGEGGRGEEEGVAGADKERAPGPEQDIFDDRDFYVGLLREVLASGGGKSNVGRDDKDLQAALQGRRAKKLNRVAVERRASKGRKIRYRPIEKLQSFMAPRPRASSAGLFGSGLAAVDAMLASLFATAP